MNYKVTGPEDWSDKDKWHKQPNSTSPYPRTPKPYPGSNTWEPTPPKVITINDLFPRLDRLSIGWSPLLEQLKQVTNNKPTYPPYDIVALDDDHNILNVAVAGFNKKELSVTVQDSILTIEGKKASKEKGKIVYQGIAARDFELSLAVAEYWEVIDATVEDGMLTVLFQKELPEEKKPKVIDIH